MNVNAKNELVGKTIDTRFELTSIAGVGGMGTVYKAKQVDLDRIVAVKVLDTYCGFSDECLKRFVREARTLSSLSNIHIAKFYSYGFVDNERPYFVMEFIEGQNLLGLLEPENQLNAEQAINIGIQICSALEAAHQAGIIHRDLKPSNILVSQTPEPNFVRLVDFGLSYIEQADGISEHLTRTGTVMGTPQYLSPEQCMGRKADQRSDIYSLGCIIYHILCGSPPFDSENPLVLIQMHVNSTLTPASKKSSKTIPRGLDEIIAKCLTKDPDKRYQSASELAVDLQAVQKGILPVNLLPKKENRISLVPIFCSLALISVCSFAFQVWSSSQVPPFERCKKDLRKSPNGKQLEHWFAEAKKEAAKEKINETDQIFDELLKAHDSEGKNSKCLAETKLGMAKQLFETKQAKASLAMARSAFFDLHDARLNKELHESTGTMVDSCIGQVKKTKLEFKPYHYLGTEKNPVLAIQAQLMMAIIMAGIDRFDESTRCTESAADSIKQINKTEKLDPFTQQYVMALLSAYSHLTPSELPHDRKVHVAHNLALASLHLCEASGCPQDEAKQNFLQRRQVIARSYLLINDNEGAYNNLKAVLELVKDDPPNKDTIQLHALKREPNVRFLDVGPRMLDGSGRMSDKVWWGDGLHPKNYDTMFDTIKPELRKL